MCDVCCPSGSLGGSTVGACRLCPAGHYCSQRGIAEPSGQCAEGYYCPEGQSSETPQQHVCSAGHHCEKVKHPILAFKLLSSVLNIVCDVSVWVFLLSCGSHSVMKSALLHQSCLYVSICRCCWCTMIVPDDAYYSSDIKPTKINLMVAAGQCQTDSLSPRQLPVQARPGQLRDMPCWLLLSRSR